MKVTKLVDDEIDLENIYLHIVKNETEPNRFEKQQEAIRIEKKKYFILQVNIL